MLAVGEASRLRRRLVEAEEVAVSVHVSWGWRIDPGVFLVFVELAPGVKAERAERLLWDELAKLSAKGSARASSSAPSACCAAPSCTSSPRTTASPTRSARRRRSLETGGRRAARSQQYAAVTVKDVRRVAADLARSPPVARW